MWIQESDGLATIMIQRRENGLWMDVINANGTISFSKFIPDDEESLPKPMKIEPFQYEPDEEEERFHRDTYVEYQGQRVVSGKLEWWPVTVADRRGRQVTALRRLGFFAGVRDWTRGRHWDRRSRYGVR